MLFKGVQSAFRVIPMQLMSQRYNALVETNGNKIIALSWCWSTTTGVHPWIHQENFKQKFWHRRWIWLDCKQQSENSILALTCLESDWEPNTIIIEYSFLFPTVIYTLWYDKRFRNYKFLNIGQAAVILCWQTATTWENCIFDHRGIIISENLQYQTRS
jgi:hypothetical protein